MENTVSQPHVMIYVAQLTPRVEYTFRFLLEQQLGLVVDLRQWDGKEVLSGAYGYGFTEEAASSKFLHLPCEGLLFESHIRSEAIPILEENPLASLKGDLFSLAFVFLTQYNFHARSQADPNGNKLLDEHGRQVQDFVHTLVHKILDMLESIFGKGSERPAFDYEITIDIDNPWKYLNKAWYKRWGGFAKDVFKGDWSGLKERWTTWRTGKDPFDVLQTIKELCPPSKTTAFILADGNHPLDSPFDLRMDAFQAYVNQYKESGFHIGIHPSYTTYKDQEKIGGEKRLLEKVVGPVTRSRQHFLRYSNPDTWNNLLESGITREYSLCPLRFSGSEVGFLRPFPWFNLLKNEATQLCLVPACMMDRGLLQYQNLSPDAAARHILQWIEQMRVLNGHFVIILHNETFSDSGEWKGWRKVITQMMEELRKGEG